jgi:ABC-type siderophore export system fused ATPase/permease subunit
MGTHDDHYFDVADKVLKMKQGKLEVYNNNTKAMFLPVNDQFIEENPF